MSQEIIIDEVELVSYIQEKAAEQGTQVTHEQILAVLDLEFEFLKLKGVVIE